jgi:hypothetical protein
MQEFDRYGYIRDELSASSTVRQIVIIIRDVINQAA